MSDSLVRWAQEEKEDGLVVTEDVGERVKPIAIQYIISIATYQIGLLEAGYERTFKYWWWSAQQSIVYTERTLWIWNI